MKQSSGFSTKMTPKLNAHLSSSSSSTHIISPSIFKVKAGSIQSMKLFSKSDFNSDTDFNEDTKITTSEGESMQGYVSSDIRNMGSGKQTRVLLYISLALLPCLLLIPFFMNRDFLPPMDTDMIN